MKLGIGFPVWMGLLHVACCEPLPPRDAAVVCIDSGDAGTYETFEQDKSAEALGGVTPCAKACKNLSTLGCPESRKYPAGRTCVETCKAISTISSFDPVCVSSAKDVAAVRGCPQIRCLP